MGLRGFVGGRVAGVSPISNAKAIARATTRILRDLNEVAPGLRLVPGFAAICN
jgi:hypothetical protein